METIYFVMPAYNEEANIEQTVRSWYPIIEKINSESDSSAFLVIANDGSKDKTMDIMKQIKSRYNMQYFVPLDKQNGGHGQTLCYLYSYAMNNNADYVFQTDSDGQTSPDEFWQMFENRAKYDFQIGFRKGREDGISRVFVTKVLRIVVWLMFGEWVIDANTPFRLMKSEKLKEVLSVIPKDYFLCNVAISAIAKKWNYSMKFYEITFRPRNGGVNSINLRRIIKIGFKALSDFRRINLELKNK